MATFEWWHVGVFWAWYDLWIGAFWDRRLKTLYICLVPTVVIQIGRGPRRTPPKEGEDGD